MGSINSDFCLKATHCYQRSRNIYFVGETTFATLIMKKKSYLDFFKGHTYRVCYQQPSKNNTTARITITHFILQKLMLNNPDGTPLCPQT